MLRLSQVAAITGLSKTKIYQLQIQGDFPMRVQLSPRRVAWVEAEGRMVGEEYPPDYFRIFFTVPQRP